MALRFDGKVVADADRNVIFAINVNAAFSLSRAALAGMKRVDGGR